MLRKVMNCNWKIFWENFNECLHCPGIHKDLSRLVPIYGRGLMGRHDDPERTRRADNDAPEFPVACGPEPRHGRETGASTAGLSRPDFSRAFRRADLRHQPAVDVHRRPCRLCQDRAAGAARLGATELTAEWLFSSEALADPTANIDDIVAFGRQVLEEDADICEINQKGLPSMRHKAAC